MKVFWQTPEGEDFQLETQHRHIKWASFLGFTGFSYRYTFDQFSEGESGRISNTNISPRNVDMIMHVHGATEQEISDEFNQLGHIFRGTQGDGRIYVTRDLKKRYITCRYQSGLESAKQLDPYWWETKLSFLVIEPHFYDHVTRSVTFQQAALTGVGWFPFFPLTFIASAIFDSQTVVNNGTADAWPVWTITGPGSMITLQNTTTGQILVINTTLGPGDQLIIDTRPLHKSILGNAGSNEYDHVVSGSDELWPLIPHGNVISIGMNNADANSRVVLDFQQRYFHP